MSSTSREDELQAEITRLRQINASDSTRLEDLEAMLATAEAEAKYFMQKEQQAAVLAKAEMQSDSTAKFKEQEFMVSRAVQCRTGRSEGSREEEG